MNVTVARHGISTEHVESGLALLGEDLAVDLGRLRPGASLGLASVLETALVMAEAGLLLDPGGERAESREAFLTAAQAAAALFAVAGLEDGEGRVEARIGGAVRTVGAGDSRREAHAGNWLTAFWLAAVCREEGLLDGLAAVPVGVLRESGAVEEEYARLWVEALQAYRRQEPEVRGKVEALEAAAGSELAGIADREHLVKVVRPAVELFGRFVARDQAGFDAALVRALELHREYWTADGERAATSTGFVALAPLAVACLAHDAGMRVEVASEYLPVGLVTGR
ncbi:immunity 49 family protein [Kitasatospora sp. NPDC051853]|uniref:immunity 49 family protein n=1 Tax=Kitasatospora sp. NPDC051853 TaxID=3364058 RepID=UPI0037916F42